jgi:hypothetical protein
MEELGPLSMLLSWQTLVLAMIIATTTSGLKTVVDVAAGGTEARRKNVVLTELVIPAIPGILGIGFGAFLPFHPDPLIAYIQEHEHSMRLVGASYGFVVSIFSDWLYQRVNRRLRSMGNSPPTTGV